MVESDDPSLLGIPSGILCRRLLSVYICRDRCSNLLQHNQLGFGVKRGAEAAIHAARAFINSHDEIVLILPKPTAFVVTRPSRLCVNMYPTCSITHVLRMGQLPSWPMEITWCHQKKVFNKETLWGPSSSA